MDIIDQTRRYLDKIPPAVSGAGGHNQTFASLAFSSRVRPLERCALSSIFRTSKSLKLRSFMTAVAKGNERNVLLGDRQSQPRATKPQAGSARAIDGCRPRIITAKTGPVSIDALGEAIVRFEFDVIASQFGPGSLTLVPLKGSSLGSDVPISALVVTFRPGEVDLVSP